MRKRNKKKQIRLFFVHAIVFILAITWVYPYLWTLINAFKKTSDIFTTSLFSGPFTIDNFKYLLQNTDKPFIVALGNSIFITIIVTVCVVLTSTITAYALTKFEFKGKKLFHHYIILQMIFPSFLFIVPWFVLMRSTSMLDTYSSMFLPYVMSAYAIFLAIQGFRSTPNDYIESARIDGAGEIWIAFRIMAPLNRAILAIIAIITFNGIWDNFIWPLIVVQSDYKIPFSVLIATFNKNNEPYVGPTLAGAVIQNLPMILVFIIFKKHLFKGINVSLK